jgi:hypothetical protein
VNIISAKPAHIDEDTFMPNDSILVVIGMIMANDNYRNMKLTLIRDARAVLSTIDSRYSSLRNTVDIVNTAMAVMPGRVIDTPYIPVPPPSDDSNDGTIMINGQHTTLNGVCMYCQTISPWDDHMG